METDAGGEPGDEVGGASAEVVAGQLNELIGQVEELLEDEDLLPPPCDS